MPMAAPKKKINNIAIFMVLLCKALTKSHLANVVATSKGGNLFEFICIDYSCIQFNWISLFAMLSPSAKKNNCKAHHTVPHCNTIAQKHTYIMTIFAMKWHKCGWTVVGFVRHLCQFLCETYQTTDHVTRCMQFKHTSTLTLFYLFAKSNSICTDNLSKHSARTENRTQFHFNVARICI